MLERRAPPPLPWLLGPVRAGQASQWTGEELITAPLTLALRQQLQLMRQQLDPWEEPGGPPWATCLLRAQAQHAPAQAAALARALNLPPLIFLPWPEPLTDAAESLRSAQAYQIARHIRATPGYAQRRCDLAFPPSMPLRLPAQASPETLHQLSVPQRRAELHFDATYLRKALSETQPDHWFTFRGDLVTDLDGYLQRFPKRGTTLIRALCEELNVTTDPVRLRDLRGWLIQAARGHSPLDYSPRVRAL